MQYQDVVYSSSIDDGVLLPIADAWAAGNFTAADSLVLSAVKSGLPIAPLYVALAQIFRSRGASVLALRVCDLSLHHDQKLVVAHVLKGDICSDLCEHQDASEAYAAAVALSSRCAVVRARLGASLLARGDLPAAESHLRAALQMNSELADAITNLAVVLSSRGLNDDAERALLRLLSSNPNYLPARFNLGNVQRRLGKVDAAIRSFSQVIACDGKNADAFNNLGNCYLDKAIPQLAADAFLQASRLRPTFAEAFFNRAVALLLMGEWSEGWLLYEWRWKRRNCRPLRDFGTPHCDGLEEIAGKVVLVYAEQGFGDSIQFCRFIPYLSQHAAEVILEVPASLTRLMSTLRGGTRVIETGTCAEKVDLQIPMLSLPRLFRTLPDSVPNEIYLRPDTLLTNQWGHRLSKSGAMIGLAWSGSPSHRNDYNRTLKLKRLIQCLPRGPQYVSVQREVRSEEEESLRGSSIADYRGLLTDFAETAALLAHLVAPEKSTSH